MKKIMLLFVLSFGTYCVGLGQLLIEQFNYPVGTLLTANGWTAHSGAGTNSPVVVSPGLTYSGYASSGGNCTALLASGEDDNKPLLTSQTSGSVYAAVLVNVSSAGTTGDYFFHFYVTSTIFTARLLVKKDASSNLSFGIYKGTVGSAVYTPFSYSMNTTYLIVIKHTFNTGTTTDDVVSLFINPATNGIEPTPTITETDATSDPTSISAIAVRQGTAGNSVNVKVGSIRVDNTWAGVVPAAATPVVTANPATLSFGSIPSGTTSAEQTYNVSGINLTADITVTAPTGYQVSKTTGGPYTGSVTVTRSGNTVPATPIYVVFSPGTTGYFTGNITNASTDATTANVAVSGYGVTTYYSASSGNLDLVTSWGTNTNGTGTNPADFTSNYQTFYIQNNAAPTIGAPWTVSGTASKVVLGDGTNPVNFTIPYTFALTGTIDLSANSTLTIQNSTIPAFGTINVASTVVYNGTFSQTVTPATYGNLTLSAAGTTSFAGNTTTVTGDLVINNTTLDAPSSAPFATLSLGGNLTYLGMVTPPIDGNSITLITTGTGTQTITGNGNTARWFRLQTTFSGNNIVLSDIGGFTDLTVGNVSGGGVTLATGSQLTLNSNTLEFFAGNVTISGLGTISCAGTSNITINKNGATTFGTLYLTGGSQVLNNLFLNMSGAGNVLKLGTDLTVNNILELTSGTINLNGKTLSYGLTGYLDYNGPGYTTTTDAEFPAINGPSYVNIFAASPSGLSLHANRSINGDLIISSGQKFIIPASVQLTINSSLANYSTADGLVIASGGSLIQYSTGVQATVNRFVSAWTDAPHGWHFLSSPVTAQPFQPTFVSNPPSSNEDFYFWDETTAYWINSKVETTPPFTFNPVFGSNFLVGKGYLVAYGSDATKSFTGELNVSNVLISNLTNTPGGFYNGDITPGWNLLGNPFTSAVTWNDGAWSLNNVGGVAKIWNEPAASYTDIIANGIIPAMQGFMVEVDPGTTGSLYIPSSSRTHSAQAWYKTAGNPCIKLVAHDQASQTAQESMVIFDNQAAPGYNPAFDSRFLPGYAPSFYSVKGSEHLSTNVLPGMDNQSTIPFNFIKTAGSNYSIEALNIENVPSQVYLTDLKLDRTQNLGENPVYNFTATDGDNPARFLLSFSHTGISDNSLNSNGIYTYASNLYIVNPGKARMEVYSLSGQKLLAEEINCPGLYKTSLYLPTAYYVVRLTTGSGVVVTKVYIQS